MENIVQKGKYQKPSISTVAFDQDDVVKTSNGADVDYQQQGWSGENGFDNPFAG